MAILPLTGEIAAKSKNTPSDSRSITKGVATVESKQIPTFRRIDSDTYKKHKNIHPNLSRQRDKFSQRCLEQYPIQSEYLHGLAPSIKHLIQGCTSRLSIMGSYSAMTCESLIQQFPIMSFERLFL